MTSSALSPLWWAAATVRFVLELASLVGLLLGLWQAVGGVWGLAVGVLAALAAALLWGRYVSPRAAVRLPGAQRYAVELVVILGAAAALWAGGHGGWALVFVAAYAVDVALLLLAGGVYAEPPSARRP